MTLAEKLMDCIKCEKSYSYIRKMDELGELEQVLPITKEMKSVGECKYHVLNCFEHSLGAVEVFEEITNDGEFFDSHIRDAVFKTLNQKIDDKLTKKDLIKLGIFLHDMGKPLAMTVDDNNRIHFKKHEILGANEIFQIGSRLGLSKRNINLLYKYIRYHMTLLEIYRYNDMSKANLFSIFDKLKDESIDIFLIGYADIVSTRRLIKPEEDIGVIKSYMTYGITNYIYRYSRI
ncbi:HD domain-containing protein [Paraclostridium sordellii]|uniref:HD domain-containing protein n=1 Tax=Paraclostridium sordellii TaxID=1505 RepID=UPI0005E836FC|nr:HD domain-containing protein [Paeniclostridium sordellii]CEQ19464.1 polyA polymerase family protein [[Clostridium] sordellii] [Paeniclostridium sordellii]